MWDPWINPSVEMPLGVLLLAVVFSGVLGSHHCIVMCGPLMACQGGLTRRGFVGYHLGRLLSYTMAGALAGQLAAGAFARQPVVVGIVYCLALLALSVHALTYYRVLAFPQRLRSWTPTFQGRSPLALGLMTPFIPCGWLFGYLALAGATGDPLTGAAVMGCFSLSAIPALGLAKIAGVRLRLPPHFEKIAYGLMLTLTLLLLTQRASSALQGTAANCH